RTGNEVAVIPMSLVSPINYDWRPRVIPWERSSDEESRCDGGRTCFIALDAGSPMSRRACSTDRETRVERAADTGGQAGLSASATLMNRETAAILTRESARRSAIPL